ncbi:MAG: hypothetical protein MHPSP_001292, partial [Paramarteilia canceri]
MGASLGIKVCSRAKIPNIKVLMILDCIDSSHNPPVDSIGKNLSIPKCFRDLNEAKRWNRRLGSISAENIGEISLNGRLKNSENGLEFQTCYQTATKWWNNWFDNISETFLSIQSIYKMAIFAGHRD